MNTTTTSPFGPGYADQLAANADFRKRQANTDSARWKATK